MPDTKQDANGNFLDSTGVPVKTPDGKSPIAGEQVQILNNSSEKVVTGTWNGTNVVENKEEEAAK